MPTQEKVIIVPLPELTAALDPGDGVEVNILAKHDASNRVMVLVRAAAPAMQQLILNMPNAGVMNGNNFTPDNHEEWRQLALPTHIKGSTDPVEIFKRGVARERIDHARLHGEPHHNG